MLSDLIPANTGAERKKNEWKIWHTLSAWVSRLTSTGLSQVLTVCTLDTIMKMALHRCGLLLKNTPFQWNNKINIIKLNWETFCKLPGSTSELSRSSKARKIWETVKTNKEPKGTWRLHIICYPGRDPGTGKGH